MLLVLPYPPSVNHYWMAKGKLRFLSPAAKKFRASVASIAHLFALQYSAKTPLAGRISMQVNVFPPDLRTRDIDNILKACLDSLTHAGVYLDDSQIDKLLVCRCDIDRPLGRIEVIIKQI